MRPPVRLGTGMASEDFEASVPAMVSGGWEIQKIEISFPTGKFSAGTDAAQVIATIRPL